MCGLIVIKIMFIWTAVKLTGCCCPAAVQALWSIQLPINIRAHISNMDFTADTYKQVFEAADQVFLSSKQVNVAALAVARVDLNETQPAFSAQNQPSEVAAVAQKPPKKNKKNKNQNASSASSRGQKHSSVPDNLAEKMCDRHHRHGASAWYCLKPSSCPWKDKVAPKP